MLPMEFGISYHELSTQQLPPQSLPKIMTMPIHRTDKMMSGPKGEIEDTVMGTHFINEEIESPDSEYYSARTRHFRLSNDQTLHFTPPILYSQLPIDLDHKIDPRLQQLFADRQLKVNLHNKHDKEHAVNQDILSNNWGVLINSFYKEPLPHSSEQYARFNEVNLTEYVFAESLDSPVQEIEGCGVIDFLGMGPNAIIIVEFSPEGKGKSKQLGKQTRGLIELCKHSDIAPPQIIPYKGMYAITEHDIDLRFSQPAENYFPREKFSLATSAVLYDASSAAD